MALDITVATRFDYRPDLSRRALYAAFPSGGEIKDKGLKRKWFTFAGIIEGASGNIARSIKYKLVALELSEQLKDSNGLVIEWLGFANSRERGWSYMKTPFGTRPLLPRLDTTAKHHG